jgi:single-stranded-DNA-specific exonuclease
VFVLKSIDDGAAARLAAALGVTPVTGRCLAARGLEEAEARAFLAPRLAGLRPPRGLADLDRAVARVAKAVRGGERIGVFGDYDVDGVTTCALLTSFLRQVGGAVVPRVARRDAGYGFGTADVAHFAAAQCGLVITGDCGTSDVDAIAHARSLGIDVVVVDHHTVPAAAGAHPACALINPLRADSTFPFRHMASVGLAFYLAASLRTALEDAGHFTAERPRPDPRDLLDLVAIGTIADLVPLRDENRILTAAGLRVASRQARPGVAALLARAADPAPPLIDEHVVGWKLSPRLNAPGRLGDAAPALSLLLSRDAAEAAGWAARIEEYNDRRRDAQTAVCAEAEALAQAQAGEPALVVAGDGWPSGIVGIVAAKLVEEFGKPAFVIAVDPATGQGRGSARSAAGVNLYDALHACAGALERYGGHAGAAGLTVARDRIDELRRGLSAAVAAQLAARASAPSSPAAVAVDAEVTLADVDERLADELARLAPFGKGNDEPLLLARRLEVVESRRVGDDQAHLKLRLRDGDGGAVDAIAFRQGDRDPGAGATVDVAFMPSVNAWNGQRRVELTVKHLAPHPALAPPGGG